MQLEISFDLMSPLLNERWQRIAFRRALQSIDPHCLYCGRYLTRGATLDHVLPLSRGGGHHVDNLVLSCSDCNVAKANRTALEWLADLRRACDRIQLQPNSESGVFRGAV